ncbi:MAG: FtsK/SpoIIIE domain-containing protein [Planctomycetota bacterium]
MTHAPDEGPQTPLDRERRLVDLLWQESAARAAAERDAAAAGARSRSLNERMHRSALDALEASFSEQMQAIAAEHDRDTGAIEDATTTAFEKVKADEKALRAQALRQAEQFEEDIKSTYDEKVWMAESVYEGAVPVIRKEAAARAAQLDALAARLGACADAATQAVRGYRQIPLAEPRAAEPADAAAIEPAIASLESAVARLRACRVAGIFRGPILVIPLAAMVVGGLLAGMPLAEQLGWSRMHAGAVGAGGALALFALGTAVLYAVARREVKARYLPFLRQLAQARAALEGARTSNERTRRDREEAARRARDADLAAADAVHKPKLEGVEQKLAEYLAQVDRRVPHYQAKVMRQRSQATDESNARRHQAEIACRGRRDAAFAEEQARHAAVAAQADAAERDALAAARESWRGAQRAVLDGIAALAELDREATREWGADSWTAWQPPAATLAAMRIGRVTLPLARVPDALPDDPALAWPGADRATVWDVPAFLAAPDRMSLVVEADADRRAAALRIVQNAVARILVSIPPGKARFTFVDPVGLGQSFAGFMHLADEMELLVTDRIWTDVRHIEQRLADLTEHMETVIQKYLRNEYPSLEAYNAQAGEIAEPYRFLVMADFPVNVSDQAAKRFASILQSGARCGVHVILLRDTRQELPPGLDHSDLRRSALTVSWRGASADRPAGWSIDEGRLAELAFAPDDPPDDAFLLRITRTVGREAKAGNRIEVPFSSVAPRAEERWSLSSARSFRVPLGRSGANRLQYLALGEGTSQHALIAGKTGSGKSSLLNAMIVNTALWYSPDEVEFWLIDFKKGVEFKAYASNALPHARAVAVESDREFGLSVLQGLDDELKRRGELFRSVNVQNLADWRALGRPERMPRCLLVIDEFQELFIEDDKVAQDSALLLDRLVRQGRAFGMHVVLGSQTLGGAYGIARSTMGQMGVRIALQCTEADSQLILSDDNTAARLLTRPGEAIYNDAGGLLEGNSPFQVVWIGDEEREAQLREVTATDRGRRTAPRPRPIVFEGNQPADPWANGPLLAALAERDPGRAAFAPKLWLGDAVSIKEPTHAPMVRRSGSNLAIVGQRDEAAAAALAMAMVAIAAQAPAKGARITMLDGTTPDDRLHGYLASVARALPLDVELPSFRDAGDAVVRLGEELARRTADGSAEAPGWFILVNGIHRYRALRRNEDDYGYSQGDGPPSPDKVLALLLKEGPLVGMHCVLWADTVASLQRAVDRTTMRELDWKALFQMGANDSSTLIDSPAASRLGFNRALLANEESGLQEKFRPYALPDAAFLEHVSKALRAREG